MKILVKPPGSPRNSGELARMAVLAADTKCQQEEKAALAEEAKRQELMDEMKPLALSGPSVIVSKTEMPLVSKLGE